MKSFHLKMIVRMTTSNFVGDRLLVRETLLKSKAATGVDAVPESPNRGVPCPRKPLGFRVAKAFSGDTIVMVLLNVEESQR